MNRTESRPYHRRRLHAETLEPRHLLSATVFERNGIGYFADSNEPKLHRYNILTQAWMSPITLTGATTAPTAALVDQSGIFAAFDRSVYRYNSDGSVPVHIINAQQSVSALHSDGSVLFINHSSGLYARFISVNKSTNTVIDTIENYVESVYGSEIAPQVNRILGRSKGISPADITYVSYTNAGTFTGGGDSPYHGDYPGADRTWVFPGGMEVVDDSGTVYATDSLQRLNSFSTRLNDIDFYGDDVPIVLSGNKLTAYSASYLPTGSTILSYTPQYIFVNLENVITFTPDSSESGFVARLVPLSDLEPEEPGAPVDPRELSFTPDKIEPANDGSLLLFSKAHRSIFRWDPVTREYSQSIPLIGTPNYMAYSATNNTAYVAYASGLIRSIDFNQPEPVEVPFANLASAPIGLSTADQFLFAADGSGAWGTHYTFSPTGALISAVDWNYYSTEYVWSSANRKMYFFRDGTSPNDLLSEAIDAAGKIGETRDSPLHASEGFVHPLRIAPSGSIVVLGSGMIHDASTLARKTESLANSINDAAWLDNELYTLRNIAGVTQYQQWGPTYGVLRTVQMSGVGVALVNAGGNRLIGISLDGRGIPRYVVFDRNLQYANLAPVLDNTGEPQLPTIDEDTTGAQGMLVADLIAGRVSDADTAAKAGIAIYFAPQAGGKWQYSLDNGSLWQDVGLVSATSARLLPANASTKIRFEPNSNYNGERGLYFRAWDQTLGVAGEFYDLSSGVGGRTAFSSQAENATITVQPVNDAPRIDSSIPPQLPQIAEDGTPGPGITVTELIRDIASDRDGDSPLGIAVIYAPRKYGHWEYSTDGGDSWVDFGNVSRSSARLLSDTARLRFVPKPNFNGEVELRFLAWDGTEGTAGETYEIVEVGETTPFSRAAGLGKLVVTPVNDAPLLNTSLDPALPDVLEDSTTHSGTTVATLLRDAVFDRDGDVVGMAIRGSTGIGSWQYSLDRGTTWDNIGTPSDTTALLLPGYARVRFVPKPNTWGTAMLQYRAWDRTQGRSGSTHDVSDNGETTAFSRRVEGATAEVLPTNDDPFLSTLGTPIEYRSGDPAVLLAPTATVRDPDRADFFDGRLRVRFDGAIDLSAEFGIGGLFSVDDQGRVLRNGLEIGLRTSDGRAGSDLIVQFTSEVGAALVEELVRSITFHTDGPAGTRSIYVSLTDGDGGTSEERNKRIRIT